MKGRTRKYGQTESERKGEIQEEQHRVEGKEKTLVSSQPREIREAVIASRKPTSSRQRINPTLNPSGGPAAFGEVLTHSGRFPISMGEKHMG